MDPNLWLVFPSFPRCSGPGYSQVTDYIWDTWCKIRLLQLPQGWYSGFGLGQWVQLTLLGEPRWTSSPPDVTSVEGPGDVPTPKNHLGYAET